MPNYSFYRSSASGLFLPSDDTAGHRQPTPDDMPSAMESSHVWVSWSDLYGPTPTYDDVVGRLRPYGLETVLATLAAISRRISIPGADDVLKAQADIMTLVFDDPVRLDRDITGWRTSTADSDLGAPPIVKVFHELQVVTATKIALLAVPPAPANGPSSLQAFGEGLLMVNDLIGQHTRSHELAQGIREPADLDRWIRFIVPNRLFHGGGNRQHALARSLDLYLKDRPHLRSKTGYVNLPALFERITGVSSNVAHMAILVALAYATADYRKQFLTVDAVLEASDLDADVEQAVFALFSERADTLRQELDSGGYGATIFAFSIRCRSEKHQSSFTTAGRIVRRRRYSTAK